MTTRLACLAICAAMALSPPPPALAEEPMLLSTRTLRANHVIAAEDLTPGTQPARPGFVTHPDEAIGMEARVTLYTGRPIPLSGLGPPALVERNQLVTLIFRQNGLEIRAEGRALGRAALEDAVRVMNLASRTTVTGHVTGPGVITVP